MAVLSRRITAGAPGAAAALAAGSIMAAGVWEPARLTPAVPEEALVEAEAALTAAAVAALRRAAAEDPRAVARTSSEVVSSKYTRQERG